MFDIGAAEILVIAIVAILVIGPKDMPLALRTAGRWIGQVRRVSSHFRAGLDAMVREAEMEEMEKKWKERNAQIMRAHPDTDGDLPTDEMTPLPPKADGTPASGDISHDPEADDPVPGAAPAPPPPASAEARTVPRDGDTESTAEPRLPLEKDGGD